MGFCGKPAGAADNKRILLAQGYPAVTSCRQGFFIDQRDLWRAAISYERDQLPDVAGCVGLEQFPRGGGIGFRAATVYLAAGFI